MLRVMSIIFTAAVVEEGEQFDDGWVGATLRGDQPPESQHAPPMSGPMKPVSAAVSSSR